MCYLSTHSFSGTIMMLNKTESLNSWLREKLSTEKAMRLISVVLRVECKWSWEASNCIVDVVFQLNCPGLSTSNIYSFGLCIILLGLGGLNNIYFATALQARNLSSKCRQGCFCRRSLFVAYRGCLCSPCVFTGPFLCGSLCLTFVLIRTPVVGLGPALMTSFKVTHLFKDPIARYSHTLRYGGLGLQHINFWRGTIEPIAEF